VSAPALTSDAVRRHSLREVWRTRLSAGRTAETDAATRLALGAVVSSRLIVWISAVSTLAVFGRPLGTVVMNDPYSFTEPFHSAWATYLVGPAARWDSVWYLHIAHSGYFSRASSAFFPLYPLLIHFGTAVFGSPLIVGALISIAAMTVGLYLLYLLARLDLSERAARTTVLLLAFFPSALFLSAVYTEALFLMLSVGAIYAARLDRWGWAGLLGCLAAATRSNGILIALPLMLLYLYGPRQGLQPTPGAAWWRPRYCITRSALWLALVPVGAIAYLTYLGVAHHAPFAPFQVEGLWRRGFAGPFGAVVHLVSAIPHDIDRVLTGATIPVLPGDPISWNTHDLIDSGFLAFAALGLAFSWRRVPVAYFAYAFVMLGQTLSDPSSTEPLASFARYVLVIFPLFMGWGCKLAGSRALRGGAVAASAGLLAGFSALWGVWAWVA
jgi:hypothetical protein